MYPTSPCHLHCWMKDQQRSCSVAHHTIPLSGYGRLRITKAYNLGCAALPGISQVALSGVCSLCQRSRRSPLGAASVGLGARPKGWNGVAGGVVKAKKLEEGGGGGGRARFHSNTLVIH